MWSLSPHLRADHMGNSMKIRMRFIQNMQWRQQKGCEKNDALYEYDSFWSHPWCQKIRTTLKKGGLLLGYNPRAPGSRLKARARTSSRPGAS